MSEGERIGVFGGTFDPPHHGHLATALEVHHALDLDRTLLVVAGDPWQKTTQGAVTSAPDRLALVRAAVGDIAGLEVSTIELDRPGPSYSIDTLEALRTDRPGAVLHLIVGSDAAAGFPTWHRADDLAAMATIVVVDRGGREGGRPPAGWDHLVVDVPAFEISSSDIRSRVARGRPIRGLVAPAVADLIERSGLYRTDGPLRDSASS